MRTRCDERGGVRACAPGYSLLEVLVSLLIVALLLGGLYTVLFQTQTSFESQELAMSLRQEARVVISELGTELRMVGFGTGNLTEGITRASATELAFVSDIDGGSPEPPCGSVFEAAPDGGAERITYRLLAGDLLRSVDCWNGAAWSSDSTDLPVAHNVLGEQPLFRYFDEKDVEMMPGPNGLTSAERAAVRSIGVQIELEDPTAVPGHENANVSVRTRVTLRNIDS